MKIKISSLMILSVMLLVAFAGVAIATANFTLTPSTLSFDASNTAKNFTVKNTGSETANFNIPSVLITDSSGNTATVTLSDTTFSLAVNATKIVTANVDSNEVDGLDVGAHSKTVAIEATDSNSTKTINMVFSATNSFCTVSNNGKLDVTIDNLNVKTGFGPEDDQWYPGDEIEVDVQVENNGNEDIDNIEIEWQLMTKDGKVVIDDTESDFDLRDGDDDTITFTINLDPEDLEASEEDYVLLVRATGEVDGGDFDGEDTCDSDSNDIQMLLDNDFVVLSNINVPETIQCDVDTQITADVWNVGDDDQDDVVVILEVPLLKIYETIEIGDIDSFDKERLSRMIKVPATAKEGRYEVQFTVLDEDEDVYENDENDESVFKRAFTLSGNCEGSPSTPGTGSGSGSEGDVDVTASLESEAKAGESLSIKANIKNSADKLITYEVKATGHSGWGTLRNIEPGVIALGVGESKDVILSFDVNSGVSGDQQFTIEVRSDGDLVASQPVSFTVEKSSRLGGLGGITGGSIISGDNWYLWGIGALNVILVIIIIIVAIRIAKS